MMFFNRLPTLRPSLRSSWIVLSISGAISCGQSAGEEQQQLAPSPETQTVASGEAAVDRPNIVMISLDTCRSDRLGCYGNTRGNSPYIDKIAAEGVVFEDCIAQSSSTGPSHRSIFCSQYVHRHGMKDNYKTPVHYSLAGELQSAGWTCAGFSAGGYVRPFLDLHHGFDVFEVPEGMPYTRDLAEVLEGAFRWLDNKADDQPFFLFVHGYDPHCPYWPQEPWRSKYGDWYAGDFDPQDKCGRKDFGEILGTDAFGPDEEKLINDMYDAGVASGDAAIGSLLEKLENKGLLEDSMIIVLSDHGESLGEHDWIGHVRMWDEQLQVPLVIRFPQGQWVNRQVAPVQLVDVLPTILDYLDMPTPDGVQGVSLLPLVTNSGTLSDERLRLARFNHHEAIYFGNRWKIILERGEKEVILNRQFFNLQDDPKELNDLFQTEEGRKIFDEYFGRYREWRKQTKEEDRLYKKRQVKIPLSNVEKHALNQLGYAEEVEDDE